MQIRAAMCENNNEPEWRKKTSPELSSIFRWRGQGEHASCLENGPEKKGARMQWICWKYGKWKIANEFERKRAKLKTKINLTGSQTGQQKKTLDSHKRNKCSTLCPPHSNILYTNTKTTGLFGINITNKTIRECIQTSVANDIISGKQESEARRSGVCEMG